MMTPADTRQDLASLTALELGGQIRRGERSAVEVWDFFLARMQAVQGGYGAFLQLFEHNRSQAEAIDRRVAAGEDPGLFAGVPVALKDNIAYAGHPLTCASKILDGYVSPFSATAVDRLLDAGAVVLGRTNMDELGMGSSCERSAYQLTRNPWDAEKAPGGSSGGSAAAVAMGLPLALGTDTGGSIRQPAAFCGTVGLKPSYGRVSRYGLVAFTSSTDQIGPLTPDVESAAAALALMAGEDRRDATSSPVPVPAYLEELEHGPDDLAGLRIGVLDEVDAAVLAPDVAEDWQQSLDRLRAAGAELKAVSVPNLKASIACYYVISNSEASANLSRLDGLRYGRRGAGATLDEAFGNSRVEGLGDEVRRRILLGTFTLSSGYYEAYYGRAQAVRRAMQRQLTTAFEQVDILVTPTSPTAAFAIGERTEDPLAMYLADIFTTAPSLAGLPGLSVPSGLSADGLPLGLQILGPSMAESVVLRVGRIFQRRTDFPRLRLPELDGR